MYERDRIANAALALAYGATALVIVAVYREPIAALLHAVGGWYRQRANDAPRSIRGFSGRLWSDVNGAIDDAG